MQLSDISISYQGDLTEVEDITRCLRTLIMTPVGTCPLDREFGVSQDPVSLPIPVAQNEMALEIISKIDRYEPRVTGCSIDFEAADDGKFMLKVVCQIGETERTAERL